MESRITIVSRIKDAVDHYNETDLRSMILHLVPEYTGENQNLDLDQTSVLSPDLKTG